MPSHERQRIHFLDSLRTFYPLLRWSLMIGGIAGVTVLLLLFAGVFHEKVPSESKVGPRSVPTGAQVATCRRVTQPRYESAIGTIKPVHEADIAAKILARVVEVNVSAGKRVNAGDVLVKLSDDELVSRVRQAEAERDSMLAQLQLAQSEAARATQLIRTNALSRSEYDAAMTRVQTSQAAADRATRAVEEAKIYLSYATIVAPFSGMVVDKAVEQGDTVTPGSVLLTMYDPTHMQLVANVRESLATKLKVGQVLGARLETQDYECQATISEVVPKADTASRSFEVKVTGPCPPGVYSGMFGRLLLPLEEEQLLLVPRQAIMKVGQLTQVFVAKDQHMVRRSVQVGRVFQDEIEILAGLAEGEQVIVSQEATLGSQP